MGDYNYILKFLGDITLILLFIRYITYGYGTYGSDGVFRLLYRATEMFCVPLRPLIPLRIRVQTDYAPLLAMVLVVLGRGVLYSVGDLMWRGDPPADTLVFNVRLSMIQFLDAALWFLVIFLFLGAALLRGGAYYSQLLFRVLTDYSAAVFRTVHRVIRISNEWLLFGGSLIGLSLVYAILWGLVAWNPFIPYIWMKAILSAAYWALAFFSIALFIAIILSWFNPDPYNPLVQALAALTYPALNWARRTFPWARVEMFNFSPIIIFLILMVVQAILLSIADRIPHVRRMDASRTPLRIRVIEEPETRDPGVLSPTDSRSYQER